MKEIKEKYMKKSKEITFMYYNGGKKNKKTNRIKHKNRRSKKCT